jgi:eukaryotic-like serine/threonine-protein kinase
MTGEMFAGRYRLLEPLGRGAMSAVWLAHDEELARRVAVKMLAPSADRSRFEREARAAAALSHPNICALYDYGEADGRPYMVLEYLPNGSLEERLAAKAPLPDAETLRIATELAAGLAHAHERGLVHRDLKPANILFDAEDRAEIADFGIARMGNSGTLTEAGTVLGTASYISPEQAAGLPAGPASDVYSFGVILFRMLTGTLPFLSTNAMELVRMHRDDEPPTVVGVRPDAPALLASIATAALAKDPAERPADGAALQRELLGGGGEAATMLIAPGRRVGGKSRRRAIVPLAAAAAVLLVAGGALAIVLTDGGSGGGGAPATTGGLTIRSVPSAPSTTATVDETTTAPLSTTRPTAAPGTTTTTQPTTTVAATTTVPGTTPTTTPTPTPTTTATTTTAPSTTAPVTTTDTTTPTTTDQGTTTATAP